jgi:hypothetical protein
MKRKPARKDDASQPLVLWALLSQRLYWTMRKVSETPVFAERMPVASPKLSAKAIEAGITGAVQIIPPDAIKESEFRSQIHFWFESSDSAWKAVGLLAARIDGDDHSPSRWSVETKAAISRLCNLVGSSFEGMVDFLRRHPDVFLPAFWRLADDLSALVTTLLIVQSPDEMPKAISADEMTQTEFAAAAGVSDKWVSEHKRMIGPLTIANLHKVRAEKDGRRHRRKPSENPGRIESQMTESDGSKRR